ncbi:PEP-CTERM sorting domain-containing protein [Thalassotalea castellviae]|uniref:PEP-CTERM sorting domain-containing protein n=1 Tax=Thalassotalea castellviae TaxID=3075612 RepID=A0ABU2ZZY8_9GAMM|nr:PEP-CTERM sorting domain-containing protein [Thalassotalea sp. W431]MDT0603469.1 PEP-CTERM sorting domain-containing protein [Thalassotalea sp. W431]
MFIQSIKKSIALFTLLICAFSSQATIIDYNDYTTDTAQGLDFLDIDIMAANTSSYFGAGVTFNGRTWVLATTAQLNQLFSNITGETVTSTTSHNFLAGGAKLVLDLVADPTIASSDWLHTANGGMYIHYSCCNDTHVSTADQGNAGAWLVSQSVSVPEPTSVAIFGLALACLGLSRKQKQV